MRAGYGLFYTAFEGLSAGIMSGSKYSPITGDPAFYYRNASPYTESYNLSVERELGQTLCALL